MYFAGELGGMGGEAWSSVSARGGSPPRRAGAPSVVRVTAESYENDATPAPGTERSLMGKVTMREYVMDDTVSVGVKIARGLGTAVGVVGAMVAAPFAAVIVLAKTAKNAEEEEDDDDDFEGSLDAKGAATAGVGEDDDDPWGGLDRISDYAREEGEGAKRLRGYSTALHDGADGHQ